MEGVFIASAFVNIYSIYKYSSESTDDMYFVNLALLALLISVVSVIVASIFIRCPRCQKRIYTPTLIWKNKMPDKCNQIRALLISVKALVQGRIFLKNF